MEKGKTQLEKVAPSRQKKLCKYWKTCGYRGQKRSFKIHFKARHPGKEVQFTNEDEAFGHEGRWPSWVNKPVEPSWGNTPVENEEEEKLEEFNQRMDTSDVPSTITDVDGASGSRTSLMEAGSERPPADAAAMKPKNCDGHCSTCGASCQSVNGEMHCATGSREIMDVLSHIKSISSNSAHMKKLLTRCLAILESKERVGPSGQGNQYTQNEHDRDALFRSGRTIQNLVSATDGYLKPVEEKDKLRCTVCVGETMDMSRGLKGVFTYKFSEGTDFQQVLKLPVSFKNLRERVKQHFNSESHKDAVVAMKQQLIEEETKRKMLDSAATRLIRTGYLVLKKSLSSVMFEHLIRLQHLNGMSMGNMHHLKMVMGTLRDCFSGAVLDKLKQHISLQQCVSIVIDKVVVPRCAMNIISVTTIVPNAPADALVQSFVVATPIVKDHEGECLTRDLQSALSRIGVTSEEMIAALGSDEEYHHSGVAEKLKTLIVQAADDYPTDCLPAVWNPVHLIHLADSDVRNGELPCDWVNHTIEIVSNISRRFKIGEGLEDLMECVVETDGMSASRSNVCWETRFAARAAGLFAVFLRRAGHLKNALKKQIVGETRPACMGDLQMELESISSPSFMAKVMALHDIYKVLGATSKAVQNTQSLPWERLEDQQKGIETLEKMELVLLAHQKKGNSPEELLLLSERDILWPSLSKSETSLQVSEVAQISFFCGKLAERLQFRNDGRTMSGSQKGTSNAALSANMADIRAVADLNQLAASHVPVDLAARLTVEATGRLVCAKLVPSSAIPEQRDVECILDILRQNRGLSAQELLKIIHHQSATSQFVATVCRLWLIFPPGSVIESMTTIIGEVFEENRPMDHDSAEQEFIVRWNAPALFDAAPLLEKVHRYLKTNTEASRCLKNSVSGKGTVLWRQEGAIDAKAFFWKC